MSEIRRKLRSAVLICLCLAIAGPALARHRTAGDFDDDWDDWDSDYNFTIERMHRESLSSAEEQTREQGRAVRREELESQKERLSSERQEYFQSVLEASQAALRAPRGVFYRKPGDSTQEAPVNARQVEVGGVAYLYDEGIFWLLPGPPYIVVTAPIGAVVDAIPATAFRVVGKQSVRFYHFGTFYEEKAGKYEVIKPPPGTLVSYLPDGYRQEQVRGVTHYRFGEILFQPSFVQGVLIYQVVEQ